MQDFETMSDEMAFAEITKERIGSIHNPAGDFDKYYLLTRLDDTMTPEQAEAWILPQVYQHGNDVGGSYFCHRVTIAPVSDNKVIAIVHHQLNT